MLILHCFTQLICAGFCLNMLVCQSLLVSVIVVMPGLCPYVWGRDGRGPIGRVCFGAFKYQHRLAKITWCTLGLG